MAASPDVLVADMDQILLKVSTEGISILLSRQFVEDFLHNEEAGAVLDHTLEHTFLKEDLKVVLDVTGVCALDTLLYNIAAVLLNRQLRKKFFQL